MVVWPLRPVRRRPQPARLGRRRGLRRTAWLEALEDRLCLSLPAQFTSATDYVIGPAVEGMSSPAPASVAAGDLTGSGRTDLVAVTPTTPQVTVLQNKGDGTFTPLTPVLLGAPNDEIVPQPDAVVVADVNGDGRPDIVVADYGNDTLVVLLNTTPTGASSPTFAAPQVVPLDLPPTALVAGNLVAGDTRPDLVAAEPLGEVAVLVNQTVPGSSTVAFATNFYKLPDPVAVAVGPFTGSSHQDIAVADGSAAQVTVLPGNGDGTFGQPLIGVLQGSITAVVPYSDPATGLQGFAAASQGGTVSLFGQTATGPLTPQAAFAVGSNLQALATADVNGDGVTDIVAADAGSYSAVTVAGPFSGFRKGSPPEQAYAVGALPTAVVAADLNGDGAPDLAVANAGSNTVSVLLNLGGTRTTLTSTPTSPQPYQPITFTATVTSTFPGQATPTGTVAFVDETGTSLGSPPSLGLAPLVNGVATFTDQSGLAPGVSRITAVYGGDQQGVPGLFPSSATETLVVTQVSPTPTPAGPAASPPGDSPPGVPPDIPFPVDPTSTGRDGPGTDSPAAGAGGPTVGSATVVLVASPVAALRAPLADGGGAPASDARVAGVGLLAAWSDAEAPARSEFGPAFDSVSVASVTAVVAPPAEKSQGQARPAPRAAGAPVEGLPLQHGLPADKASVLVASTFDGDDSVALFEAVAKGWATPAATVRSTTPAGDTPTAAAPAEGPAVNALLVAAAPAPAPPDGPVPGTRGAVDSTPLTLLPAFVGAAALAVTGLWFSLIRLRPRTAPVSHRRPDTD